MISIGEKFQSSPISMTYYKNYSCGVRMTCWHAKTSVSNWCCERLRIAYTWDLKSLTPPSALVFSKSTSKEVNVGILNKNSNMEYCKNPIKKSKLSLKVKEKMNLSSSLQIILECFWLPCQVSLRNCSTELRNTTPDFKYN